MVPPSSRTSSTTWLPSPRSPHQATLDEIARVIRDSAGAFASLHMSPRELAAVLKSGERLTLLDVRKREEYDARGLPGSRLLTAELTFEILDSWPEETLLLFYSNDGSRSLDTASHFRAYGMPAARTLTGGRAGWDAEIGSASLLAPVKG